jgi:hypothetical protein
MPPSPRKQYFERMPYLRNLLSTIETCSRLPEKTTALKESEGAQQTCKEPAAEIVKPRNPPSPSI